MPEIRDKVLQGEATSNGISDQLRDLINPMLQADFINQMKVLDNKTEWMNAMIASTNANISEHGNILDEMKIKFGECEPVKTVVT